MSRCVCDMPLRLDSTKLPKLSKYFLWPALQKGETTRKKARVLILARDKPAQTDLTS